MEKRYIDPLTPEAHRGYILELIQREIAKPEPDQFWDSVWFSPSDGRFLYGDRLIPPGVVEPLIKAGTLKRKPGKWNLGERMIRYQP